MGKVMTEFCSGLHSIRRRACTACRRGAFASFGSGSMFEPRARLLKGRKCITVGENVPFGNPSRTMEMEESL